MCGAEEQEDTAQHTPATLVPPHHHHPSPQQRPPPCWRRHQPPRCLQPYNIAGAQAALLAGWTQQAAGQQPVAERGHRGVHLRLHGSRAL